MPDAHESCRNAPSQPHNCSRFIFYSNEYGKVQEAIDFFARKFTGLVRAWWTNDEMITVRANDPACVAADAFVRPVGPPHSNYRYTILPEEAGTRSQTRAVVQEFIGLLIGTMPDALPRISVRLVG